MTLHRMLFLLLLAVFNFTEAGCMGVSGGKIAFDDLKYPVSLSGSLYGPFGDIVDTSNGLKIIKDFEYDKTHWRIFYSVIALTQNRDVAEEMNKAIEDARGDGMIYVSISSGLDDFQAGVPLTFLPFWPSLSKIKVTGSIVKLEQRQ